MYVHVVELKIFDKHIEKQSQVIVEKIMREVNYKNYGMCKHVWDLFSFFSFLRFSWDEELSRKNSLLYERYDVDDDDDIAICHPKTRIFENFALL